MGLSLDLDDARHARTLLRAVLESSLVLIHMASFVRVFNACDEFVKLDLPYTCLTVPGVCPPEAVTVMREELAVGNLLSERYAGWATPLSLYGAREVMTLPAAWMLIGNVIVHLLAAYLAAARLATTKGAPARLSDMETCYQAQWLLQRRCARFARAFHVLALLCAMAFACFYFPIGAVTSRSPAYARIYENPTLIAGYLVSAFIPSLLLIKTTGWWAGIRIPLRSAADFWARRDFIDAALKAKLKAAHSAERQAEQQHFPVASYGARGRLVRFSQTEKATSQSRPGLAAPPRHEPALPAQLEPTPPFVSASCSTDFATGAVTASSADYRGDDTCCHVPFLILGLIPGGSGTMSAKSVVFAEGEQLCRAAAALCPVPPPMPASMGADRFTWKVRVVIAMRLLRQMVAAATVFLGLHTAMATLDSVDVASDLAAVSNASAYHRPVALPFPLPPPFLPPPPRPPSPPLPPHVPSALCSDLCIYSEADDGTVTLSDGRTAKLFMGSDGECQDGGPGSVHSIDCAYGSDCTDCGPRQASPAPPPYAPGALCIDRCFEYTADGECQDGGPGSEHSDCTYGSDCTDCGPRQAPPAPPPYAPGDMCVDECNWETQDGSRGRFANGACEDGGPGAQGNVCGFGTDCTEYAHEGGRTHDYLS